LSVASLEPVIISRTEVDHSQTPFDYLLASWIRAVDTTRLIRQDIESQAQDQFKVLTELKRVCVSYAGLSLMMPDMFGYSLPNETICWGSRMDV
jgi:hypothetical protein